MEWINGPLIYQVRTFQNPLIKKGLETSKYSEQLEITIKASGVKSMGKKPAEKKVQSNNHDNLIKISKVHRIHHYVTLFGYFLIAAAIGGIILTWAFLSKILFNSVNNGSSFIVHTFLFALSLTVIVGILGFLLATKKQVVKFEGDDSKLTRIQRNSS
jgi:hypothetical protein